MTSEAKVDQDVLRKIRQSRQPRGVCGPPWHDSCQLRVTLFFFISDVRITNTHNWYSHEQVTWLRWSRWLQMAHDNNYRHLHEGLGQIRRRNTIIICHLYPVHIIHCWSNLIYYYKVSYSFYWWLCCKNDTANCGTLLELSIFRWTMLPAIYCADILIITNTWEESEDIFNLNYLMQ